MQREYGRLNVEGTILSKRRIAMLVEGTTVGGAPSADELADDMDAVKLEEEGEAESAAKPTTGTGRKIPQWSATGTILVSSRWSR